MLELQRENRYLEYKKAKRSLPKDFWEIYSSFANTEGRLLVM